MPTFEFQATHPDGTVESGNIVGPTLEAALSDLGKRGLQVEKIGLARIMNDPLANFGSPTPKPQAPMPHSMSQAPPNPPIEQTAPPTSGPAASPYDYDLPHQQPTYSPVQPTNSQITETPRQTSAQQQRVLPDLGQRSYVATNVIGPVVGKIPMDNVGFMFRQFGTMLNAGVPIVQSLDTLSGQAKHPQQKQLTQEMMLLAKEGLPISQALQRYPESISPVMISMIRAGEEGGFLDAACHQVADYIDREIALRNLYKRSTLYPKLVFATSFVVIGVTNTILASIGEKKGLSSPLSVNTWIFLTILAIGIWLFMKIGLADHRVKYWWDRYVLKVPALGPTLHQLAMARFGRAFGALYKAGVPVAKSMQLSADACGNEYLRATMYPYFRRMDDGGGILETLRQTGTFSPIVLDMIGTGEKTGNIEQMVNKVSEYYEGEAETRQNSIAAIFGVVLFLAVAVYVGFMVVKFYTEHYGGMMQSTTGGGASSGGEE